MATTSKPLTTEEFLALPDDDGVERELIGGELRERTMTTRGFPHSRVSARITKALLLWSDARPEPRGEVVVGEARFRIRRNPDTTVGIDVAYISPERLAATPDLSLLIDGPPVLAVEVLSPSDTQENIDEKIQLYLNSGVPLVWVVNPVFKTVMVYRRDEQPRCYNKDDVLTAEPHLPGFAVDVAALFGA